MQRLSWVFIIWLLMNVGCDPCSDCGEPLIYDPTVKVIFINQDSAVAVQDSVTKIDDSVKVNTSLRTVYIDSVNVLTDSVVVLDTLIAQGASEYEATRAMLADRKDSLEVVSDSLNSWNKHLGVLKSDLNSVLTKINAGWVQLQQVRLLENGAEVNFVDSMRSFNLPLLLDPDNESAQTTFELAIAGFNYQLGFKYINYETIDGARRVFVEVANVDTTLHTFDSLSINCRTSECISDETTVTAYF